MRKSLIALGFAFPCAFQGALAQNVPGKSCYYPVFKGYFAATVGAQRKRTEDCLIRISYEIAAMGPLRGDTGLFAADYCQQAYTDLEKKVAAKEGRFPNLDAAREQAAAFARPWIWQAIKLKCLPPSAR